jgi:hypothetical protein
MEMAEARVQARRSVSIEKCVEQRQKQAQLSKHSCLLGNILSCWGLDLQVTTGL